MRENQNNIIKKSGWLTAVLAIVLVAALLTVSILIALVPDKYTLIDATSSKRYTLSDNTKSFLSTLDEDVTVYILNADGSNAQFELFVKRYTDMSKNITLEYADTVSDPEILTSHGYSADIQFSTYSILVSSEKRAQLIDFYSLFYYSNKTLGVSKMTYSDYNYYYAVFSSSADYAEYLYELMYSSTLYFEGDAILSGVVEYVTLDSIPHPYIITGHGENSAIDGNFAALLGSMSYSYEMHDITTSSAIPEDANCIVINEPTSDYTENETKLIMDYLKAGGRLLLITDTENLSMKNLMSIAEYYGASSAEGLITVEPESNAEEGEASSEANADQTEVDAHKFDPIINQDHDIFASFSKEYTVKIKNATAISISKELRKSQIVTSIVTSPETSYISSPEAKAAYTVGVAVEEETESGTTKLVWLTGADSYNAKDAEQINLSLPVFALAWMSESYTSGIGEIDAVVYDDAMLNISNNAIMWISTVIIILIPVTVLTVGIFISVKRRKA